MNKLIEQHPAWRQLQADRVAAGDKLNQLSGRISKATEAWRERVRTGRERWLADNATDDDIAAVVEPVPDLSEINQQKQELIRRLGELSQPNGPVERAVLTQVARDVLPQLEASERALVESAAQAAKVPAPLARDWQLLIRDVERLRVALGVHHQNPVYRADLDIHTVLDAGLGRKSLLNRPPAPPAGTRATFTPDPDAGVAMIEPRSRSRLCRLPRGRRRTRSGCRRDGGEEMARRNLMPVGSRLDVRRATGICAPGRLRCCCRRATPSPPR